MRRSLFGSWTGTKPAEQSQEFDDYGSLPDMEASPREQHFDDVHGFGLTYHEPHLHPEGTFEVELVGHHQAVGGHIVWRFRRADHDASPGTELPRYVTGSVCRPGNHLDLLLT